jgi:hypothetical protein
MQNALRWSFVFLLAGRGGWPRMVLPAMSLPLAMRSGMTRSGVPRVWNPLTQSSRARMSPARSSIRWEVAPLVAHPPQE